MEYQYTKYVRFLADMNRYKIKIVISVVAILVCIVISFGFLALVYNKFVEEGYSKYDEDINLYVEMSSTEIMDIYTCVEKVLHDEIQGYVLTEVNYEFTQGVTGISYLEFLFVKHIDEKRDLVSAKLVVIAPDKQIIERIEGYEGAGRAFNGSIDPIELNRLETLYEDGCVKGEELYEEKGISIFVQYSKIKMDLWVIEEH